MPAARSSRANATRVARSSPPADEPGATLALATDDLLEPAAYQVEVVTVLDHRSERVLGYSLLQVVGVEHLEGLDPVDGLGDTRRLGEVELAQPLHGSHDLACQQVLDARNAQTDDLDLTLGRRIAHPVVETAALEGVVQLARAVGG